MSRHWAPFGRCPQYPVHERIQRPAQIRARPPARDLETWQNRHDHWRYQDHRPLPTGLDAYDIAWELTQRLHQTVDSPANLAACEVAEAELDRLTWRGLDYRAKHEYNRQEWRLLQHHRALGGDQFRPANAEDLASHRAARVVLRGWTRMIAPLHPPELEDAEIDRLARVRLQRHRFAAIRKRLEHGVPVDDLLEDLDRDYPQFEEWMSERLLDAQPVEHERLVETALHDFQFLGGLPRLGLDNRQTPNPTVVNNLQHGPQHPERDFVREREDAEAAYQAALDAAQGALDGNP